MPITFNIEDLKTPDRLERVLRQFSNAIDYASKIPALPDTSKLAELLATPIRDQLQATGIAPLNLQSLLPSIGTGTIIVDTHANRLAIYNLNSYPVGTLFYETDRTVIYVIINSSGTLVWLFVAGSGPMRGTLSPDTKPTDIGANDVNFRFYSTDYGNEYRWDGSVWLLTSFPGPGFVGSFRIAPTIGLWQLCDGTVVTISNTDGTLSAGFTVPDYTTSPYLKLSTVTVVGPTAASGVTGSTTATNQATTATNQSNTTGITVDDHSVVDTLAAGVGNAAFSTPGDAAHSVTDPGHNHTQNSHNHTQDAHTHGPGTLELLQTQLRGYIKL